MDGRQAMGRYYSAFYYYGKYVCKESYWVKSLIAVGIYNTAVDIRKTFVALSDADKQIFIDQSYNHYIDRKFGCFRTKDVFDDRGIHIVNDRFYGEPTPPPKNARQMYNSEVRAKMYEAKKRGEDTVFPEWPELAEHVQMSYINKLYYNTCNYAQEFTDFIYKLSPSELIEYCIHKCRYWEAPTRTESFIKKTAKGFVFPFTENSGHCDDVEMIDEDQFIQMRAKRNNKTTKHDQRERAMEDLAKTYERDLHDPIMDIEISSEDDQVEPVQMKILNKARTESRKFRVEQNKQIDSLYIPQSDLDHWERNVRIAKMKNTSKSSSKSRKDPSRKPGNSDEVNTQTFNLAEDDYDDDNMEVVDLH